VVGEYAKPRSHFPNPIAPYEGRAVAAPNLTNTPRLDQLMQNGKLMLSMNDAIALALENNLDIAISRYNLHIADTDVLRTRAGATLLGVNTGVVQGAPGGGVGGFGGATTASGGAGGTTTGVGGAGAGTLGIVSSTLGIGSAITSYDPILTGTLQLDRNTIQGTNPFVSPVTKLNTNTYDFGYLQGFATGTSLNIGFNNSRTTTNSNFNIFSPQYNARLAAGLRLSAEQALHRDRKEQPRIDRCRVPTADHYHRRPDPEHVLGPGECLRERKGAAGRISPRR
jgi:hypothetical protein